jgi:hypothetical protein
MASASEKIDYLRRILESGVLQVTTDGVTTIYRSREDLVREIERLENELPADPDNPNRGRVKTINLGGF